MATDPRPTRWRKANDDWPGFQWRDLGVGVVGLVLAVVVLALLGFPGATVIEVVVVGGAGVAAAAFYALGQLAWAWLQAPMRLLTEDVIAIRARLDAVEIVGSQPKQTLNVRLQLVNYERMGEELVAEAASSGVVDESIFQIWTKSVIDFVSVHLHDRVELFMRAGDGSSSQRMDAKLAVLGKLIEELPTEDATDDPDA